ncbi:MAG: ketopantoate reductase family protein [Propionibacteriales bacterium]|nr:ketopantoate reductase family protein [Propionibacteriales bacterium]
MRFVIVGLGGVGGVLAARLSQAGHRVVGVARGAQLSAVRENGLRLDTPTESFTARLDVFSHPGEASLTTDDVVILAVKSQDTADAVRALADTAPSGIPVACAQNGVVNELCALRSFANVYGVVVMCPTAFLEPGVVRAYSAPVTGLLDVGRYPTGQDDVSREVAAAFASATYDARSIPDVRRWKYTKLVMNLSNAVEAVCGQEARRGPLTEVVQAEGEAVLRAAGIEYASTDEDRERRGSLLDLRPVGGVRRSGGSSWQSLTRGTGAIETDYLNGEIVLLGRLYGVPTPANALLQRLAGDLARTGSRPGTIPADDVLARLDTTAAPG